MIAVLGATGRVGGAALTTLAEQGLAVRALFHEREPSHLQASVRVEWVKCDVRSLASMREALAGIDSALVFFPTSPAAEPSIAYHQDIIGNIVAALQYHRIEHIVAISDYGAHRAEDTGVTVLFRFLEMELARLNAATVVLRSAEHMENYRRYFQLFVQGDAMPAFYRPHDRLLPMVSAADVGAIAGTLLASNDREARILHVESARRYSLQEVVATINSIFGRNLCLVQVAPEESVRYLERLGISHGYAALLARMYDAHNSGLIDIEPGGTTIRTSTDLNTALTRAAANTRLNVR